MLEVRNLRVTVEGQEILHGVDLDLRAGEMHVLMGPNGSGKTTLARVLAGHESYVVTEGSITFRGRDLATMSVEERAREGVFLSFQQPVEIPGVSTAQFLKAAVNAVRAHRGETPLDAYDFLKRVRAVMKDLDMDDALLQRSLNEGFSGGEKKRCEILQMSLLQPILSILDETDSGLDVDGVLLVARGVQALRSPDRSTLVITHHQGLLDHLSPDRVHVLVDGRIVRSGDRELARQIAQQGFGWLTAGSPGGLS